MEYSVHRLQNHLQVSLMHQFTFNDNAKFRNILGMVKENPPANITLDVSQLDFIDSAGLGMLLLLHDEADRQSISVTLANPQGQIRKMLELSNFDKLFSITHLS